MPTFDTPGPIPVTIDLPAGTVRVEASDRPDTVVEVHPEGGEGADQAHVAFVNGHLLVKAPGGRGSTWGLVDLLGLGWQDPVDVTIALPSGSRVVAETGPGSLHATGRLGECRVRTSYGDIHLDRTGPADLRSSTGEIVVDRVEGHAEIVTDSGDVDVRTIDGSAAITNHHGQIVVGEVTGDLRLQGTHGDLTVRRALADVSARNAYGDVRLREVAAGSVTLTSTYGRLEVGIGKGTAAWLDVDAGRGRFVNGLAEHADPSEFDRTVSVHARTSDGDIHITRA